MAAKPLVEVAGELLGADVGAARAADLDRAVTAAPAAAGDSLDAAELAGRLRVWSAGRATGEEAWSSAILVELLVPPGWDATVLGTDVDVGALEHARRGVYGPRSFRETPDWVRSRWFTATAEGWEVSDRLRRRVRVARSNLVTDPVPPPTEAPAPSRTADRLRAARAYLATWCRP